MLYLHLRVVFLSSNHINAVVVSSVVDLHNTTDVVVDVIVYCCVYVGG